MISNQEPGIVRTPILSYIDAMWNRSILLLSFLISTLSAIAKEDLSAQLEAARQNFGLPAVAAVLVKNGEIVAEGVAGTRRLGGTASATLDDRYHLGSDTKAMTALLAALLVEEGKLRWDLTLAEALPEFKDLIPESLRKATLAQLLSHSAGIPGDNDTLFELYFMAPKEMLPLPDLRAWLITKAWSIPPAGEPGKQFVYSNLGYIIAGHIIEKTAGKSWESLMHERIFQPLGLSSAGLGPQVTLGLEDAPLPHLAQDSGKLLVMDGGPSGDIPGVMGPAGNAHMSARDFARWAAWNAGEGSRGPALVSPATLKKLHEIVIQTPPSMEEKPGTPKAGGYAMGWGVTQFPWSERTFLTHGGSNGMNLAWITLLPEEDLGLVLLTNAGGSSADSAFRELSRAILEPMIAETKTQTPR